MALCMTREGKAYVGGEHRVPEHGLGGAEIMGGTAIPRRSHDYGGRKNKGRRGRLGVTLRRRLRAPRARPRAMRRPWVGRWVSTCS